MNAVAPERAPAPGAAAPDLVPGLASAEQLEGSEVVPGLRADLEMARAASGVRFVVLDPVTGRRFELFDFEVSVARMLDGRRRVEEVVAAAHALGIPVTQNGLYQFIRQLWSFGFLSPPGATPAPAPTRPPRQRWDEATRERFRAAQRALRDGRPALAVEALEAVLAADAGSDDARALLVLASEGRSLPVGVVGERELSPMRGALTRWIALAAAALVMAVAGGAAGTWIVGRGKGGVPSPAAEIDGGTARASPAAISPSSPTATTAAAVAPPSTAAPGPAAIPTAAAPPPPGPALLSPGDGTLTWHAAFGARVAPGEPVGHLRSPRPPSAERRAKLAELARLAAQDPVYREFLEREEAAARADEEVIALPAPAAGRLEPLAGTGATVRRGDPIARIVPGAAR